MHAMFTGSTDPIMGHSIVKKSVVGHGTSASSSASPRVPQVLVTLQRTAVIDRSTPSQSTQPTSVHTTLPQPIPPLSPTPSNTHPSYGQAAEDSLLPRLLPHWSLIRPVRLRRWPPPAPRPPRQLQLTQLRTRLVVCDQHIVFGGWAASPLSLMVS